MRTFDHHRAPGHLEAWREINQRVAAEIQAGQMKPARVVYATADRRIVSLRHALRAVASLGRLL